MPIDWPRFIELVGTHQRFLLTSHVRPDCDALGSELGMAGILEALGKQVVVYVLPARMTSDQSLGTTTERVTLTVT